MLKRNYLYRHLFLIIFWAALWFVVWIQVMGDLGAFTAFIYTSIVMTAAICIAQVLSDKILPKAIKTKRMKPFILKAVCAVLLLAVLIGTLDIFFISHNRPIRVEERPTILFVQFYKAIISSLLMNGTACGIRFYQEHTDIQRDHNQLQQLFLESQIKSLQDQINPNFMFNVLNHIQILMKTNTELADYLLLKFSDMLRYQLYESNQSYVLLSRELQYLKDFIAIEKIRWGEELQVNCHWSVSSNEQHIAPLVLIYFVENAFKHVSRLPNQPGLIDLICHEEMGRLQFTISNSSWEYPLKIPQKNIGLVLQNIRKKLDLHYENNYTLTMEKKDNHFTVFLLIDLI